MSDKITVVKWVAYDSPYLKEMEESIGGLGGWFGFREDHTWDDYIATVPREYQKYVIALKKECHSKNIKYTGEQHQYSGSGVPVFSDNTYGSFSYRGWGDLMAAIWTDPDKGEYYNYMDFYM